MLCYFFHSFCCRLLTFFKINFFKKKKSGTLSECQEHYIRVSKGEDPELDRHSVGPDVGPICLQRLSDDGKSEKDNAVPSVHTQSFQRTHTGLDKQHF